MGFIPFDSCLDLRDELQDHNLHAQNTGSLVPDFVASTSSDSCEFSSIAIPTVPVFLIVEIS